MPEPSWARCNVCQCRPPIIELEAAVTGWHQGVADAIVTRTIEKLA